jgi:hypothetical protein
MESQEQLYDNKEITILSFQEILQKGAIAGPFPDESRQW